MAQRFGEDFKRPVDPFTGLPYPGAPEVAMLNTTRPSGSGYVVLRDDVTLPIPPSGPGGPSNPSGN